MAKIRKRSRSGDYDSDDSMPISKRINGLHIQYSTEKDCLGNGFHNNLPSTSHNEQNCSPTDTLPSTSTAAVMQAQQLQNEQCDSLSSQQNNNSATSCSSPQTSHFINQEAFQTNFYDNRNFNNGDLESIPGELEESSLSNYQPELSRRDNPHYYQINELLFNAHKEKLLRSLDESK